MDEGEVASWPPLMLIKNAQEDPRFQPDELRPGRAVRCEEFLKLRSRRKKSWLRSLLSFEDSQFILERREVLLAIVFALAGFIFSMREWILTLNSLNPLYGFFIYCSIVFIFIFGLSRMGLVVLGVRIKSFSQMLGLLCITFAFFIIVNWESEYVNYVVTGNFGGVNIFYQAEDGATWFLWQSLISPNPADLPQRVELIRFMTYVFSVFLLTLLGGILLEKKPKLSIL